MEIKERKFTQCGTDELEAIKCVFPHCSRCSLNDTTEKDILNWMVENVNDNSIKTDWDFWGIYNDRSSASWGWNEAQKVAGQRVVWLHFSPSVKDGKSSAGYNYISEAEFQAGEPIS